MLVVAVVAWWMILSFETRIIRHKYQTGGDNVAVVVIDCDSFCTVDSLLVAFSMVKDGQPIMTKRQVTGIWVGSRS